MTLTETVNRVLLFLTDHTRPGEEHHFAPGSPESVAGVDFPTFRDALLYLRSQNCLSLRYESGGKLDWGRDGRGGVHVALLPQGRLEGERLLAIAAPQADPPREKIRIPPYFHPRVLNPSLTGHSLTRNPPVGIFDDFKTLATTICRRR